MTDLPALRDRLGTLTQARILLGRAGQALPTRALLDFQLDHARARDAVHIALEPSGFSEAVGRRVIEVQSRARNRSEYLKRPDLGRQLDPDEADQLRQAAQGAASHHLAIIVADGLSATAIHRHAASMVVALIDRLPGWRIAPFVLARQGRVALGDAIGQAMGVDCAVVLIGERPGLSAPHSAGLPA